MQARACVLYVDLHLFEFNLALPVPEIKQQPGG